MKPAEILNLGSRREFLKTTAAVSAGGILLANAGSIFAQEATIGAPAKKVKGTETEQNLLKAFAGESQARNRYTMYAEKARKDGFHQIAAIFDETAGHEVEHAKRFYSYLEGGTAKITAEYPAGIVNDDTAVNLKSAAAGENEEWSILYPQFGKTAAEEGFPQIAELFKNVCVAEKMHENRYLDLMKNIEADRVFERDERVVWKCRNCGYIHTGREALGSCPACRFTQGYFELFIPNW